MFDSGDLISHTKMLTFYRKEAFELEALYKNPNNSFHSSPFLGKWICGQYIACSVCVGTCNKIGEQLWRKESTELRMLSILVPYSELRPFMHINQAESLLKLCIVIGSNLLGSEVCSQG